MKVWVTRAEPGASATAERLRALGHDPVVAPLLSVREREAGAPPAFAALAFTSANAVGVFGRHPGGRDVPVFTVGDATARAARAAGYTDIRSAEGDVAALAALILSEPIDGVILHPCAAEPAGDLVGVLLAEGRKAERLVVYETLAVPSLPETDGAEAVLIHSPRAARTLAALMSKDGRDLAFYALSPACAAPLAGAGFRAMAVAESPDEASLLALLPPAQTPRKTPGVLFWLMILAAAAAVATGLASLPR